MSSISPASIYPALFTKTSIPPYILSASSIFASRISCGEQTSNSIVEAPASFNLDRREGDPRVVAMTLSPRLRAMSVRCSPKPEEQPVMNHVSLAIFECL